MTSSAFARLKANRAGDFHRIARMALEFPMGTHRTKRLRQSLGDLAEQTSLHRPTAEAQAKRLRERLIAAFGDLAPSEAKKRIRFVTILHDATPLNADALRNSITRFKHALQSVISDQVHDVRLIGVIEIELMDRALLAKAEQVLSIAKGKPTKKTKLTGYDDLLKARGCEAPRAAVVHCHAIIDAGPDAPEKCLKALAAAMKLTWTVRRAIRIDPLHKDKSLHQNLAALATYLTKGGNERLQYKTGDIGNVEAGLWSHGQREEPVSDWRVLSPEERDSAEVVSQGELDELALNGSEIELLGRSLHWLATRTEEGDGYIVDLSSIPPAATLPGLT